MAMVSRSRSLGIIIVIAALCLAMTGCVRADTLKTLTARPQDITLYRGETQQLDIIASYTGGRTEKVTAQCTYQSSNTMVLYVSDSGKLLAQAPGAAAVTVTYSTGSDSRTITFSVTVIEGCVLPSA